MASPNKSGIEFFVGQDWFVEPSISHYPNSLCLYYGRLLSISNYTEFSLLVGSWHGRCGNCMPCLRTERSIILANLS
jgi:hypothetical protein